jgi:hypothetical protein
MTGYSYTIPATIDDWAAAINEVAGLQASGAGTLSADAAAGATSLAIAGAAASKVLSAGSFLQIAGINGRFEVTSDEAADGSGNLASTAIAPGLPKPVAAGTAVFWEQTVIPVDALETAATYPRGTRLTVAGDATVYTVAQAFTTSSGAADVRLTQGLQSAPADNAVVTIQVPLLTNAADGPTGIVTVNITGIAGGAVLTPEGTINGATWFGIGVVPTTSTTMATAISADGAYRFDATGLAQSRLRITTAGTGSITVQVMPSIG